MKISTEKLIADLIERTRQNLNQAEEFNAQPEKTLNWKPAPESWSALECLAHLNLYGNFYLPEIQRRINSAAKPAEENFKSGWLGNYFAKMMLPREKLNKMKTFKDKDSNDRQLNKKTLIEFIDQQKQLLDLLHQARGVSLNKTRTSISISKWIKLKLGDTLRVVIYHNQRHLVQASKATAQYFVKNNVRVMENK